MNKLGHSKKDTFECAGKKGKQGELEGKGKNRPKFDPSGLKDKKSDFKDMLNSLSEKGAWIGDFLKGKLGN